MKCAESLHISITFAKHFFLHYTSKMLFYKFILPMFMINYLKICMPNFTLNLVKKNDVP